MPAPGALDLSGLTVPEAALSELLRVDVDGWLAEVPLMKQHFDKFGARMPQGLREELGALEQRLQAASVGMR